MNKRRKKTNVITCPFLFRNKVHSFRDGIIGSNRNEEKYPINSRGIF